MVDASEAFDTEAVKRPCSTVDPTSDDTVQSETRQARLDRDETAKDLVAKTSAVDTVVCENQHRFDAWAGKLTVAELEKAGHVNSNIW